MTRLVWLFLLAAVSAVAQDLKPFDFPVPTTRGSQTSAPSACAFDGMELPREVGVYAAGAYSGRDIGFQIDQSGHEATQIDVAVHSPSKPVVLLLGAYEPTVWNIGWSRRTEILAVFVSGYHRQAVAGLEKSVPVLNSSYDNKGPCGYFYVAQDKLESLNPLARRLFGRPVDMVFPATAGRVSVGEPLSPDVNLVTSDTTAPESFRDGSAPLAGELGLQDAVNRGILRRATVADADAWVEALAASVPDRDVPPVAGQGRPKPPRPQLHNAYVVLGPFVFPAGLYGGNSATFFVAKGVPAPTGNPGHSVVYDFNTLDCRGPLCGRD
jgi:hypothetical protein